MKRSNDFASDLDVKKQRNVNVNQVDFTDEIQLDHVPETTEDAVDPQVTRLKTFSAEVTDLLKMKEMQKLTHFITHSETNAILENMKKFNTIDPLNWFKSEEACNNYITDFCISNPNLLFKFILQKIDQLDVEGFVDGNETFFEQYSEFSNESIEELSDLDDKNLDYKPLILIYLLNITRTSNCDEKSANLMTSVLYNGFHSFFEEMFKGESISKRNIAKMEQELLSDVVINNPTIKKQLETKIELISSDSNIVDNRNLIGIVEGFFFTILENACDEKAKIDTYLTTFLTRTLANNQNSENKYQHSVTTAKSTIRNELMRDVKSYTTNTAFKLEFDNKFQNIEKRMEQKKISKNAIHKIADRYRYSEIVRHCKKPSDVAQAIQVLNGMYDDNMVYNQRSVSDLLNTSTNSSSEINDIFKFSSFVQDVIDGKYPELFNILIKIAPYLGPDPRALHSRLRLPNVDDETATEWIKSHLNYIQQTFCEFIVVLKYVPTLVHNIAFDINKISFGTYCNFYGKQRDYGFSVFFRLAKPATANIFVYEVVTEGQTRHYCHVHSNDKKLFDTYFSSVLENTMLHGAKLNGLTLDIKQKNNNDNPMIYYSYQNLVDSKYKQSAPFSVPTYKNYKGKAGQFYGIIDSIGIAFKQPQHYNKVNRIENMAFYCNSFMAPVFSTCADADTSENLVSYRTQILKIEEVKESESKTK